jgi:hypothetical protein
MPACFHFEAGFVLEAVRETSGNDLSSAALEKQHRIRNIVK